MVADVVPRDAAGSLVAENELGGLDLGADVVVTLMILMSASSTTSCVTS